MHPASPMPTVFEVLRALDCAHLDVYAHRLYLYVLTHQEAGGHGMRAKLNDMATGSGMSVNRLREAVRTLSARGMFFRDEYAGQEDRFRALPPAEWKAEEPADTPTKNGGTKNGGTKNGRTPARIHQIAANGGGGTKNGRTQPSAHTPDGFPSDSPSLSPFPPVSLRETSPHADGSLSGGTSPASPSLVKDRPAPRPRPRPPWTESDVEAIYQAYPLKRGKGAALPKIRSALSALTARPEIGPAAAAWLLERTTAFAKSPKGRSGEFIPNPATWYNQARYDDEPAAWGIKPVRPQPAPTPNVWR